MLAAAPVCSGCGGGVCGRYASLLAQARTEYTAHTEAESWFVSAAGRPAGAYPALLYPRPHLTSALRIAGGSGATIAALAALGGGESRSFSPKAPHTHQRARAHGQTCHPLPLALRHGAVRQQDALTQGHFLSAATGFAPRRLAAVLVPSPELKVFCPTHPVRLLLTSMRRASVPPALTLPRAGQSLQPQAPHAFIKNQLTHRGLSRNDLCLRGHGYNETGLGMPLTPRAKRSWQLFL